MGIFSLLVFLVIVPTIIGFAVVYVLSLKRAERWLAAFPMGFFLELAIFQLLAFPWAMLNFSFVSLSITYIFVVLLCCILSVWFIRKKKENIRIPSLSFMEWIYAIIALLMIGFQVFHMVFSDIGYWSSDDALYGAIANDALAYNVLFRHNALTGVANVLNIQRSMQTSLLLPAFLSFVSGISVATVFHSVLGVFYLLLAYSIYMLLGKCLFKTIENTFIFLIVISALYIFGLYTIYSQTYRLLGPSTQGKAVLAVSFFPFLYTLMIIKLPNEYDSKFGIILLLLSASATSMTMYGTITMIGNIVIPVLFSMFAKKRNRKNLRYILWGSALPVLYGGILFYSKFAP